MRFFSDNAAAAHPKVIEAITAANRVDTAYDGAGLALSTMSAKDTAREERLAAALRENLRRRKAHARKIAEDKPDPAD